MPYVREVVFFINVFPLQFKTVKVICFRKKLKVQNNGVPRQHPQNENDLITHMELLTYLRKNIYKCCIIHAKMLMGQVSRVGCFIAGVSIIYCRVAGCFNTAHSGELWLSRCALRGQSGSREDSRWSTFQKTRKTDKRSGEYI